LAELPARLIEASVSGDGPAVLLLHGQPGTAGDWQWVTPHLDDRYQVVAPDRPGYGRTGGAATGFHGNARAAIDLLDGLGIERAVMVGHSWAGGVVLAAASAWPDRVSGMVLVSSVGPGEHIGWDDRLLAAPVIGEALAAATIGGLGFVLGRSRVQSFLTSHLDGRAAEATEALTRLTRGGSGVWHAFVTEQRALLTELEDLAAGLADLPVPAVVVHGRNDRLVPPSVAEHLAVTLPNASLQLLHGVGHLIPHDRPGAVAAAIDQVAMRN
jgi:pimeloyl-ACP methyl ester carboxylesterase